MNSSRFKKVLVVDDILYVVKSISKILSADGYFILTATTGEEALQKFQEYEPDLVTIDQKLPDMSGVELAGRMRALDTERKAKIIFISAITDTEEIRSILKENIDDYLVKPFKKQRLLETVRSLVPIGEAE